MSFRGVAFAAGLMALTTSVSWAQEVADRIFIGGPVLTMNDAQPRAEAVAVKDGIIIAVGSVDEIMALKGDATEVTELDGRALIPGFVDAHGHVTMGGLQAVSANLLAPPDGGVTDIAALQQALRDWMVANEAIVADVGLVIGFGYDNAQLAELRHPTRQDLDAVSTEYPIIVVHQSSHLGALNSKALELLGFDRATADPAGGVIRRDETGEPNGVLEENAIFAALASLLGKIDREGFKSMAVAGSELWAKYGYTTADEGRATPGAAAILQEVAREGKLKIDVAIYADALIDRDWIKANYSTTMRTACASREQSW
jgi:predicted amidohydrolase YtcJ